MLSINITTSDYDASLIQLFCKLNITLCDNIGAMDAEVVALELSLIDSELESLEARGRNSKSRNWELALPQLQGRLETLERRMFEIEPLAIEYNHLNIEVERIRVAIASQVEANHDKDRVVQSIKTLRRRRQLIEELAAAGGIRND
jgi:hypothetical protein